MEPSTYADPVIAESGSRLRVDRSLRRRLAEWANGRPLVIDCYLAHCRGLAIGDLRVRFADESLPPRFVRINPIGDVEVLVERRLVRLVDGARLSCWGPAILRQLSLGLRQPERWIAFLEHHPAR